MPLSKVRQHAKKHIYLNRAKIFLLGLVILTFCLDQLVKWGVRHTLSLGEEMHVIPPFFSITYFVNQGAAFGFLHQTAGGLHLLTWISLLSAFVFAFLFIREKDLILSFLYAMIFSGCVGNLYDRLFLHGVTDMFLFRFGSYSFPVFNVADILLTLSFILLFFYVLFLEKKAGCRVEEKH